MTAREIQMFRSSVLRMATPQSEEVWLPVLKALSGHIYDLHQLLAACLPEVNDELRERITAEIGGGE